MTSSAHQLPAPVPTSPRRLDVAQELVLPHVAMHVSTQRRILDVIVSAVLLTLTLPVLVVAALLIVLDDRGPVLFRQTRLGEGAKAFTVYKLRTMRSATDGPAVTATHDARITRVGAVLRRLSIDELPQLWQVLRGQMTLVGPRPESQELAVRYPVSCRPVFQARPGLTGPTQLFYREASAELPVGWTDVDEWYLSVLVPLRTEADLDFLVNATLRATLRWVVLTGLFVLGLVDLRRTVVPPTTPGGRPQQPVA